MMDCNTGMASSTQATLSVSSNAPPTATFTLFPKLPVETQLQIWACALPPPRHLDGAIPLIIGRNLSDDRAILPSIKSFRLAVRIACNELLQALDPPRYACGMLRTSRQPVLTLMWLCKQSREFTRRTYRLGVQSSVKHEQTWWDKDQRVFFPPVLEGPRHTHNVAQYVQLLLLVQHRGDCFNGLKHITLYLDQALGRLLNPGDDLSWNEDIEYMLRGALGVLGLPSLQSLTLLLDPGGVGRMERGRILYYEPDDVPLDVVFGEKPSEISMCLERSLAGKVAGKKRETPGVYVLVMGVGKWKGSNSIRG